MFFLVLLILCGSCVGFQFLPRRWAPPASFGIIIKEDATPVSPLVLGKLKSADKSLISAQLGAACSTFAAVCAVLTLLLPLLAHADSPLSRPGRLGTSSAITSIGRTVGADEGSLLIRVDQLAAKVAASENARLLGQQQIYAKMAAMEKTRKEEMAAMEKTRKEDRAEDNAKMAAMEKTRKEDRAEDNAKMAAMEKTRKEDRAEDNAKMAAMEKTRKEEMAAMEKTRKEERAEDNAKMAAMEKTRKEDRAEDMKTARINEDRAMFFSQTASLASAVSAAAAVLANKKSNNNK